MLDLTRLVSRAGLILTGIDRVEMAYLRALLDQPSPLFGLIRSSVGYVLVDKDGCRQLQNAFDHNRWPSPDRIGRWRRLPSGRAGAEALMRQARIARCLPYRLGRMLAKNLPAGTHYINVGHTNFTDRVILGLKRVPDLKIAIMIHDTIPLDFPHFQRPEIPNKFRGFLDRATSHADLLICISEDTHQSVRRHVPKVPSVVVSHLGLTPTAPGQTPQGPWKKPYFITLGTIEPRKNHKLLLDIWPEIPDAHLLICGKRGWENADVFEQLDASPDRVHELTDLSDGEVHALMKNASGLLFPSYAEGFGLPLIEAATIKTPIVCNNLPVCREILGNIPVYAPVSDRYAWVHAVKTMASPNRNTASKESPAFKAPDWETHFNKVLRNI